MKNPLKIWLAAGCLIFASMLPAQESPRAEWAAASPASVGNSPAAADADYEAGLPAERTNIFDEAAFTARASEAGIPVRRFGRPASVSDGFYLIVGVFKEGKNLRRSVRKLKRQGLDAGSFINPENNLNYVYASHYTIPEEALLGATSQLDGNYQGDLWILINGEISPAPELRAPADEFSAGTSPGIAGKESAMGQAGRQAAAETPIQVSTGQGTPLQTNRTVLLQRADRYFDIMWYAEAARLYEQLLDRDENAYSFEIIRKVADAHYFNTDMERAYHWYDILYDRYGDEMSAANLFKYAHALKGNGKYGRARRIMRLYDKVTDAGRSGEAGQNRLLRETVMDNILNREAAYGIRNLDVNSKYSEFGPMFYQDDQIVFASSVDSAFFHTRRYKWNNQPYLDLYVSRLNAEGDNLEHGVKFSKTLNTKYHEAGVAFSPDKQTVYFTRNNYGKRLRRDKNGVNHLKLYRSRKVGDEWTEAEELPFNGESYSTGHPALSPDGKQLYFVSDMPGTIGGTDIFVVDVLGDGTFSEPRNLGPGINTPQKEMFPFITGRKLYFSSNGHVGLGGLDIFQVSFDEEIGFLEVENLGQPINSKKDDFSYIVDEATQKGFFASNRVGGKGDDDLYSFQRLLPEETNENAIAGVVTDLVTGDAIPEALVTLLDANNRKLKEIVTEADGSFVFQDLDSNTRYRILVEKATYSEQQEEVATRDNEQVDVELPMRKLRERIVVEDGVRKLKTGPIYFNFDKHNIRSDAAEELDKLVAVMQEYPSMVIAIESHTDSRGSSVYNRYLSDLRAKSTRAYLIENGIDPSRIQSAKGYGEDRLLNDCDGSVRCTSQQHQLNRRSEFIVVDM
ncbi:MULTISPECIES: OmpA family protein [unclassified Robiginitalea]|uniref:OmpA family protein n=1 Tax=Robiginitalea TaxID=252306 RepID=UPI00234A493D|nr:MULTISPECIES: OmpA family protein [unclassified Robiginitalea]MDC6353183.1 OmpA family protein [Robiginitalea sp. PM2]MDC6373650.1 OmpA family protein [Robiginitalea sp. SP8]